MLPLDSPLNRDARLRIAPDHERGLELSEKLKVVLMAI
jgi:hypothetical protein